MATTVKLGTKGYIQLEHGTVNKSVCEKNDATAPQKPKLVIDFDCGAIELSITKDKDEVYVDSINGTFTYNTTTVGFVANGKYFSTKDANHYYKCESEQDIIVTTATAGVNDTISLMLSKVALEAFRSATGTDFYKAPEDCPLDHGPFSDGVRIAVGICLIAFVAIILIAYFVGRRRWSQRSSYESV